MRNLRGPESEKTMTIVEAELKPGDTFTRNGHSVTVHFIREGEVYFDKYRVEESGQPFGFGRSGWGRMGLGEFMGQVAGAAWTGPAK